MSGTFIETWLPTVVAGGALGMIWLDLRRFKNDMSVKVDEMSDQLKHALYRADGTTNYIPRSECEKEQLRCQAHLCSKIEGLGLKIDKSELRRDREREQLTAELKQVRQSIDRVIGRVGVEPIAEG